MIGTRFYKDSFSQKDYIHASNWCNNNGAYIEDMGFCYEVKKAVKTFEEAQQERILFFGQEFIKRRDAITWTQHDVGLYGYDRKYEDVTNFMAAMKRAELGLDTGFNVYVNNADDPKQFLPHTAKMFHDALEQSAQEQITAYQRYEAIKKQIIDECDTIDELNAITW